MSDISKYYSQELLDACNEFFLVLDENFNIKVLSRKDYPDFDYEGYLKALDEIIPDEEFWDTY